MSKSEQPDTIKPALPVPRVAMLSEEEALKRGRQMGIDDYITKMHLFRVLLQHAELARELNNTIISLVGGSKVVGDRLREMMIMRVSWMTACDYEWSQHWMASLFFGLTEPELVAIRDWRSADCFSAAEQAALAATDDIVAGGAIVPDTWIKLAEHFPTAREQIEIVTCIANWNMFAQILRSLDIPLDEGLASWPPDGRMPTT